MSHLGHSTIFCSLLFYRIAYSVYEIQRMLANAGEDNQIKITYDIACTLATHLKVAHIFLFITFAQANFQYFWGFTVEKHLYP